MRLLIFVEKRIEIYWKYVVTYTGFMTCCCLHGLRAQSNMMANRECIFYIISAKSQISLKSCQCYKQGWSIKTILNCIFSDFLAQRFQHVIGRIIFKAKWSYNRSQKAQDCVLKVFFDAGLQHMDALVQASNVNEITAYNCAIWLLWPNVYQITSFYRMQRTDLSIHHKYHVTGRWYNHE